MVISGLFSNGGSGSWRANGVMSGTSMNGSSRFNGEYVRIGVEGMQACITLVGA